MALQSKARRVDLYGIPVGNVSDQDQAGARQRLDIRFAQRHRRARRERRAMVAGLSGANDA